MRKTLTTVALMLALCSTTFAGEMGTPPVAPPTACTHVQGTDDDALTTESLIQAVLDVIGIVLS